MRYLPNAVVAVVAAAAAWYGTDQDDTRLLVWAGMGGWALADGVPRFVREFNEPRRRPFRVTPSSFVLFPVLSMLIVAPAAAVASGQAQRPLAVGGVFALGLVANGLFVRHLRKPIALDEGEKRRRFTI